jgi:hypothetical protein
MIVHNCSHVTLKGIIMFPFIMTIERPCSFNLSSIYIVFSQGNERHSPQSITQNKTFTTLQNRVNHASMVFI